MFIRELHADRAIDSSFAFEKNAPDMNVDCHSQIWSCEHVVGEVGTLRRDAGARGVDVCHYTIVNIDSIIEAYNRDVLICSNAESMI